MKRLFLAAILLFPVLTIGFWFFSSRTRPRITSDLPVATNYTGWTNTVTNPPAPAKP